MRGLFIIIIMVRGWKNIDDVEGGSHEHHNIERLHIQLSHERLIGWEGKKVTADTVGMVMRSPDAFSQPWMDPASASIVKCPLTI